MSRSYSVTNTPEILANPDVQELLRDLAQPEDAVTDWLGQLFLLEHVPFNNLIADSALLPKESLRFFYLDPSWLNALVDGALSVGNHTSLEVLFTDVMRNAVADLGSQKAETLRKGLNIMLDPIQPASKTLRGGLLLRSAIISDWPAFKVVPTYPDPQPASPDPIRFEKIGSDVILMIFPAVPNCIEIRQPSQGMQFGVQDNLTVYLRYLQGTQTGAPINDGGAVQFSDAQFYRGNGKNVLDIESITGILEQKLKAKNQLTGAISPADFALQMVKVPEKATFKPQ